MTIYELTDDIAIVADTVTSFAFEVDGEPHYVFSTDETDVGETFYQLRRAMMTTHWIEEFGPMAGGYYRCCIRGTDGSKHWFTYTPESLRYSLNVVESAMVPTGNSGAHNFGMLAPPLSDP